jgi:septal ring factor EnvC (AmiA/AmiB activator)
MMKNSFRLEFGTVCIMTVLTLCGCVSPMDLDNVKYELQDTQQQLQEAQKQLKDSEQQIQILQQQLKQKNADIVTMNTCLQGVGRALSHMGDGNSSKAFVNLSSVAQECQQSDLIAEKVRVEKNRISTITVTSDQ